MKNILGIMLVSFSVNHSLASFGTNGLYGAYSSQSLAALETQGRDEADKLALYGWLQTQNLADRANVNQLIVECLQIFESLKTAQNDKVFEISGNMKTAFSFFYSAKVYMNEPEFVKGHHKLYSTLLRIKEAL